MRVMIAVLSDICGSEVVADWSLARDPPPPPTGHLIAFMWAPVLEYIYDMIRLVSFVSLKKSRLYF